MKWRIKMTGGFESVDPMPPGGGKMLYAPPVEVVVQGKDAREAIAKFSAILQQLVDAQETGGSK